MKLVRGVLSFFCCISATYAASKLAGDVNINAADPKIVGGRDAPEGKYPYMVSLRDFDGYFCGGSIINDRWILTAAHCVIGFRTEDVKVVAGTNLREGGKGQIYQVVYMVSHQNYSKPNFYNNDVGLIRVNKNIEYNDKVQPVKLPTEDFYEVGRPLLVCGWGIYDKSTNEKPIKLQEITPEMVDQEMCREAWSEQGTRITESQFCMSTTPATSVCFVSSLCGAEGDSGSPVVVDGIQIGVVSLSQLCLGLVPDVAARVYFFLNWIATEQAKF